MGQLAGADVEALLRTAEAMLDGADALELTDLRTADGLATAGWTGADADRHRATWDAEHAVTLHVAAQLLRTGAAHLVTQAEEQEAASAATGPGAAPVPAAPAPAGPTTAGLRERLAASVHDGMALAETVVDALAPVGVSVTLAELAVQRAAAADGLLRSGAAGTGAATRFLDPVIGPVTAGGLRVLSGVGVAVGVHDYYHGVREGDLHRQVDGGVSAALGAAALTGNPMAAGAAAAWTLGTAAGGVVNDLKEGTEFDRRFQERMEPVFDQLGAAGMVVVPGALVVAGVETGAAAAVDAYDAVQDYAADAWRSLTGGDAAGTAGDAGGDAGTDPGAAPGAR